MKILYHVEVPDKPLPLSRARLANGHFYDKQSAKKYRFAKYVLDNLNVKPPYILRKPIIMTVSFIFKMPVNWSKSKKNKFDNSPHMQRPDIDNLIKFVLDSLNEVVWEDDALIYEISANKKWGRENSTILEFREVESNYDY